VNIRVSFLYLLAFGVVSIAAVAQTEQSLSSLLDDLVSPQNTTQAAAALLKIAETQPSVRSELSNVLPNLSNVLPNLILTSTDIEVVVSEATLAGKLQLVSAVPALVQLLDRPNIRGGEMANKAYPSTITSRFELRDDPIARALADMGAPAVQALSTPLESIKVATRTRAARILIRINTPESLSLLQQHVGREADSRLKKYIAANLARTKQ
jgi:hypothetical protein